MELLDHSHADIQTLPREAARRTLAMRIAHRNRLRAERLARLRPETGSTDAPPVRAISPEPETAASEEAAGALEEFLRALTESGGLPAAAERAEPAPAAVLHFQRPDAAPEPAAAGPGFAEAARPAQVPTPTPAPIPESPPAPTRARAADPAGDLGRLPGMGPGLARAFERAGIACLADLARLEEVELVTRLGPLGRLVPARSWLAAARDAAAPDAAPGRPA